MVSAPVPDQPTLHDRDLTLRPWRVSDAEPARVQHDEDIARWFHFSQVVPTAKQQQDAIADWQRAYADGRRTVSFVVEVGGRVAGTVEVRRMAERETTGHLSWALFPQHRGIGYGYRSVRLLIDYAFAELGLHRVEAYIDPDNRRSVRLAARAGMRREGRVRAYEAGRDALLMSRLVTDPEPHSHAAFIAGLNTGLPTKRAIAQGLIRDEHGRVLLCELTYKRYWDLPGGVVDPGESPATTVVREIGEELGVQATVRRLAVVTWLPPWHGWDDATLFCFEATVPSGDLSAARFEPREIKAVHWCDRRSVEEHAAAYTTRLVRRALRQLDEGSGTAYLEDGRDPSWSIG